MCAHNSQHAARTSSPGSNGAVAPMVPQHWTGRWHRSKPSLSSNTGPATTRSSLPACRACGHTKNGDHCCSTAAGTAHSTERPMPDFDVEVDVVVAGSGGGITGAYTAGREGLSVLLAEATDKFGGTTAYSGGGGMWYPCNPVVERAGTDDTMDAALAYFHAVVGDRTPRALQETYVRGGASLIAYLEQDPAFEFTVLPWPDYYGSVPDARNDGFRHIIPLPLPD